MKLSQKILAFLMVLSVLFAGEALAGKTAVLVSIATSGVEEAAMEPPKQLFVGRLAQLGKDRNFKSAELFIDDLSTGNGLWKGTTRDLLKGKRAVHLLESVKRQPRTCSNLVGGFRKLRKPDTAIKNSGL